MFSVYCSSSQLADKNAEPIYQEEIIGFEETVEFQCKEGYFGMITMYICTQSRILEPLEGLNLLNANLFFQFEKQKKTGIKRDVHYFNDVVAALIVSV